MYVFQTCTKFIGSCFRSQYIFLDNYLHWWPPEGQLCFFLCVLYRAEFSKDHLQIHTKSSLDHSQDSSKFSSSFNDICGHQGAKYIFFLCALYRAEFLTNLLQIYIEYSLHQDLDSNPFLLPISDICGHQGPT